MFCLESYLSPLGGFDPLRDLKRAWNELKWARRLIPGWGLQPDVGEEETRLARQRDLGGSGN